MRAHTKIYVDGHWVHVSGDLRHIRIDECDGDLLDATDALVRNARLLDQLTEELTRGARANAATNILTGSSGYSRRS